MKNLIALILLVILPLSASSQTLSNDSLCCVPCKSLKKALLVKTERDFLKEQIGIARDSIVVLTNIVTNQDSVIVKQDTTISLYKKNEAEFTQLIKSKAAVTIGNGIFWIQLDRHGKISDRSLPLA